MKKPTTNVNHAFESRNVTDEAGGTIVRGKITVDVRGLVGTLLSVKKMSWGAAKDCLRILRGKKGDEENKKAALLFLQGYLTGSRDTDKGEIK